MKIETNAVEAVLSGSHIRAKERQFLKVGDSGFVGFLMLFTVVLIRFRDAVVCLDFHRSKFL